MHAIGTGLPIAEQALDESSPAPAPFPLPMVFWVHDGPVCVTVVDPPSRYASGGVCCCPACRAHDPDQAVNFF